MPGTPEQRSLLWVRVILQRSIQGRGGCFSLRSPFASTGCNGSSSVSVITIPFPEAISPLPLLFAQASQAAIGRQKDGKLNMTAELQNQQEDSRGWVLPEMGCKARFLSFSDGLIPSPGRAAGCRSNGTLSSHHWASALPRPAFIESDNRPPGSEKQQSCGTAPLQDTGDGTPHTCGTWGSGGHPLPKGHWVPWHGAVLSDCSTCHLGSLHLLSQNVPPVPLSSF